MKNRKTLLPGGIPELDLDLMKFERDKLFKLSQVSSPQRSNRIISNDLLKDQYRASLERSKENAKNIGKDKKRQLHIRDVPMKDSSNSLSLNTIPCSTNSDDGYYKVVKQQTSPKISLKAAGTQTDCISADGTDGNSDANYLKSLEADLERLRIENIRLKHELKLANESLAALRQDENNTSSCFSLPSEFKSSWETLMKDSLVNVFLDFIDKPFVFINLIQELVVLSISEAENAILQVNNEVARLLNLSNQHSNSIVMMRRLRPIYQNYSKEIFFLTEEKFYRICESYRQLCKPVFLGFSSPYVQSMRKNDNKVATEDNFTDKQELKSVEEQGIQIFEEVLKSSDFESFLRELFSLSIYFQLADPKLRMPLQPFSSRVYLYLKYQKNRFTCIDGFAKDGSLCIQVLPSVMRNNYPFAGIRPCVLIFPEELLTEEIKNKINCNQDETQNEDTNNIDEKNHNTTSKNSEIDTHVCSQYEIKASLPSLVSRVMSDTQKTILDQLQSNDETKIKQQSAGIHELSLGSSKSEIKKINIQSKDKLTSTLNDALIEETLTQNLSPIKIHNKSIQTDRAFLDSLVDDTSLNLNQDQYSGLSQNVRANRDLELAVLMKNKSNIQVRVDAKNEEDNKFINDSFEKLSKNRNKADHEFSYSIVPEFSATNKLMSEIQLRIKAASRMIQKSAKNIETPTVSNPPKISKGSKRIYENLKTSAVCRTKRKADEGSFKGKARKAAANASMHGQNTGAEVNISSSIESHNLQTNYFKSFHKRKNCNKMNVAKPQAQSCANLTNTSFRRNSRPMTPQQNHDLDARSKSPLEGLSYETEMIPHYRPTKIRYVQYSGEKPHNSASKTGKLSSAVRDHNDWNSHIHNKPNSASKYGQMPGIEISEICFRLSVDKSCENTGRLGSDSSEVFNNPSNSSELKAVSKSSINHPMNLLNAIELSKKKQNSNLFPEDQSLKIAKKGSNEKSKISEIIKSIHKNNYLKKEGRF